MSGTGNSAVSTGFPRLRSLVHIAKQEKHNSTLTLFLHPPYNTSEADAIAIATRLRFFRLVDFVTTAQIKARSLGTEEQWFTHWKFIYANTLQAKLIDSYRAWPYMIEWQIAKDKFPILSQISAGNSIMQWLAEKIREEFPQVIVVPSPDIFHTLLLFVVDVEPSSVDEQPFAVLQRLSITIPETIHLSGAIGIENIHITSVENEFHLECQGGSLIDCFELTEVNANRSFCNDPKYMELTYGIEAGQASIMNEINAVLQETAYVDPHHVKLVVDWMGYTGSLRPVNRHTQNKIKSAGVIDRSTNEETIAVLSEGAINARSDNLLGISGQLATGKLVHAGTGVMQMRYPLPN